MLSEMCVCVRGGGGGITPYSVGEEDAWSALLCGCIIGVGVHVCKQQVDCYLSCKVSKTVFYPHKWYTHEATVVERIPFDCWVCLTSQILLPFPHSKAIL